MTLETAKQIKSEGYVQGQDVRTYEQYELLNKEAEAILRGGMNICEVLDDGSRKYIWIKVNPTKTDNESSIELAIKNHQKKKQPRNLRNTIQDERRKLVVDAQHPEQNSIPPDIMPDQTDESPLIKLAIRLKKKFDEFVKLMDEIVVE